MTSFVIYCPHLNRDIRGLLNTVPFPRIWTGEKTVPGHDGCLQCHQAIVRQALTDGLDKVFVMEDDCQFTEHFSWEKWLESVEWAEAHEYDVLVGGCVQTYEPKVVRRVGPVLELTSTLVDVKKFHSAHCIVYFKSGYEKILRTIQPFDTSIGDQGARTVMTYPFVAVQRPTFSGILEKDVDYVPLYQQYEGHLGRALGLRA